MQIVYNLQMIESLRSIQIEDYNYPLPDNRIAQFPLQQRDASKLLILKDNQISEDVFSNLSNFIPSDSLLISNETRVVHARLLFKKLTGSQIEIFCLEPVEPTNDIQLAFQQKQSCTWQCLVGNARRWKSGTLQLTVPIDNSQLVLRATMKSRQDIRFLICFEWFPTHYPWSFVLEQFGKIPLPPYIIRETSESDNTSYQTVFARNDGSVAAPTAGLHFTDKVLKSLAKKNIATHTVTLHVGAGTFKPVSSETIGQHEMHHEQVVVSLDLLQQLLKCKKQKKHVTLVGTTTVRTLESIYWQGVLWSKESNSKPSLHIEQWDPYLDLKDTSITIEQSLECIIEVLKKNNLTELRGTTSLLIAPGYKYRIPDAIVTNFHQPKSTLLLLVAAFIGKQWKQVYEFALLYNFRFLSYGDSCLFFKHDVE